MYQFVSDPTIIKLYRLKAQSESTSTEEMKTLHLNVSVETPTINLA